MLSVLLIAAAGLAADHANVGQLAIGRSSPAPLPTPNHLIERVGCEDRPAMIARVAALDFDAYVSYSATLRREALERPDKFSRARARSAVVEAVAIRAGVRLVGKSAGGADCPPRLPEALVALYGATETSDAERLQTELQSADPATRLVAANSIAHLGVIPSQAQVQGVLRASAREAQPDVRFEMIMALASQAQRAKDALPELRKLLLASSTPAVLARRIAFELPGEDLRYRLFHDLKDLPGARAKSVRAWIRAKRF